MISERMRYLILKSQIVAGHLEGAAMGMMAVGSPEEARLAKDRAARASAVADELRRIAQELAA